MNTYLTQRTINIKYNNTLSQSFTPQAGVPQGSVIGPTLYITYTHDIPQPTNNFTHIFSYADDITLLVPGRKNTIIRRAQQYLDLITIYEDNWKIKTNGDKTKFMLIDAPDTILQNERIYHKTYTQNPYPNRTRLNTVTHLSFLGTTIDKKLTFKTHTGQTWGATRAII